MIYVLQILHYYIYICTNIVSVETLLLLKKTNIFLSSKAIKHNIPALDLYALLPELSYLVFTNSAVLNITMNGTFKSIILISTFVNFLKSLACNFYIFNKRIFLGLTTIQYSNCILQFLFMKKI